MEPLHNTYDAMERLLNISIWRYGLDLYDPALCRFLSPDPIVQAPTDPQNFNRYTYCLNNPLRYTDPSGMSSWKTTDREEIELLLQFIRNNGGASNINDIGIIEDWIKKRNNISNSWFYDSDSKEYISFLYSEISQFEGGSYSRKNASGGMTFAGVTIVAVGKPVGNINPITDFNPDAYIHVDAIDKGFDIANIVENSVNVTSTTIKFIEPTFKTWHTPVGNTLGVMSAAHSFAQGVYYYKTGNYKRSFKCFADTTVGIIGSLGAFGISTSLACPYVAAFCISYYAVQLVLDGCGVYD